MFPDIDSCIPSEDYHVWWLVVGLSKYVHTVNQSVINKSQKYIYFFTYLINFQLEWKLN